MFQVDRQRPPHQSLERRATALHCTSGCGPRGGRRRRNKSRGPPRTLARGSISSIPLATRLRAMRWLMWLLLRTRPGRARVQVQVQPMPCFALHPRRHASMAPLITRLAPHRIASHYWRLRLRTALDGRSLTSITRAERLRSTSFLYVVRVTIPGPGQHQQTLTFLSCVCVPALAWAPWPWY